MLIAQMAAPNKTNPSGPFSLAPCSVTEPGLIGLATFQGPTVGPFTLLADLNFHAAKSELTLPVFPTISAARCPENAKAAKDCSRAALVRTSHVWGLGDASTALSARLIFSRCNLHFPDMGGTYQQKDRLSRAVLRFFCPAGQAQQRPWMLSARV